MIQHKKLLFGSVVKNIYIVIMLNNDLNRNYDTITLGREERGEGYCVYVRMSYVCVCVCVWSDSWYSIKSVGKCLILIHF